jgi:preprotein translocase subunit SecF
MFTKKDVAIIAGPIVGALTYSAVIITTVLIVDKVKERRAKKAAEPMEDIITSAMREAQK